MPIKLLAKGDPEFFRIIMPYLKFPSSQGYLTVREFLQLSPTIRHIPQEDEYAKIRAIAEAQRVPVFNSQYDFDRELLEKLPSVFPEVVVEQVGTEFFLDQFEPLDAETQSRLAAFIDEAGAVLAANRCRVIVRRFQPEEVPMVLYLDPGSAQQRYAQRSGLQLGGLWGSILQSLAAADTYNAVLCLNERNPLVQQLAALTGAAIFESMLRLVYLQALLLGNYALTRDELAQLTAGLHGLLGHFTTPKPL